MAVDRKPQFLTMKLVEHLHDLTADLPPERVHRELAVLFISVILVDL